MVPPETGTPTASAPPPVDGPGPAHPWRRWTGVWPVLGALVVLGALAVVLVPSVRAQAELSFTRSEPGFVELSGVALDPQGRVGTTCLPEPGQPGGATAVAFSVVSHLRNDADVDYVVRVLGADGAPTGPAQAGQAKVEPGQTRTPVTYVRLPARQDATVQVRLPGTGQELLFHCSLATRAAAGATP